MTMKNLLLPSVLILFLASCITTTHVHYSDPNYLGSDEFSTYEEINASNQIENETLDADTSDNNYYENFTFALHCFAFFIILYHFNTCAL